MYLLNNGLKIPKVGFGTWKATDKEQCKNAVRTALEIGYRHIDTAAIYGNEDAVGEGIAEFLKNNNVSREELFIVTKVWNTEQGYETTLKAYEESLKKLGLDYIDMYLIHWPQPKDLNKTWETWRALETLYKSGKVKAIGACNMKEHHLKHIMNNFEIVPAVNQIELHPYLQLVLKWHLQKGLLPLPKSVTPSRIMENFQLDFILDEDDMKYIDSLNKEERIGPDPDEITF